MSVEVLHLTIRLNDDVWGNDAMMLAAKEACAALNDPRPLIIEVIEHAGWHLSFVFNVAKPSKRWPFSDGPLAPDGSVVSTANDGCVWTPHASKLRETLNEQTTVYVSQDSSGLTWRKFT